MDDDPFDLARFVTAQNHDGTYDTALSELREGHKQSHWMWFVLPQLAGLGRSATAQRYAVSGRDEARAYLAHPVLGSRLVECAEALHALESTDATRVLGATDAQKLQSSMTLFELAAHSTLRAAVFASVLEHYFGGQRDERTLRLARA